MEQKHETIRTPGVIEVSTYGDKNAPLKYVILDPHGASKEDMEEFFKMYPEYLEAKDEKDSYEDLLDYCLIQGDRGTTPVARKIAELLVSQGEVDGVENIFQERREIRVVIIRSLFPRVVDANRVIPVRDLFDFEEHPELFEKLQSEVYEEYIRVLDTYLEELAEQGGHFLDLHSMCPYNPKGKYDMNEGIEFLQSIPGELRAYVNAYLTWLPDRRRTTEFLTADENGKFLVDKKIRSCFQNAFDQFEIPHTENFPYVLTDNQVTTGYIKEYKNGMSVDFVKDLVSVLPIDHKDFYLLDFEIDSEKVETLASCLATALREVVAQKKKEEEKICA